MTTYTVVAGFTEISNDIDSEELIHLANNVRRSFESFGVSKGSWIDTEEEAVKYLRGIDYGVIIND